jgi:solute:Na+ symporter, SSS family
MITIDYIVFAMYGVLIVSLGLYMSRTKKGTEKTAEDYFLASKSLPWWAVGTSLIAANISAEQMIGMSGQGFGMGWPLRRTSLWQRWPCWWWPNTFCPYF